MKTTLFIISVLLSSCITIKCECPESTQKIVYPEYNYGRQFNNTAPFIIDTANFKQIFRPQ